jgi:hypothetical protein
MLMETRVKIDEERKVTNNSDLLLFPLSPRIHLPQLPHPLKHTRR